MSERRVTLPESMERYYLLKYLRSVFSPSFFASEAWNSSADRIFDSVKDQPTDVLRKIVIEEPQQFHRPPPTERAWMRGKWVVAQFTNESCGSDPMQYHDFRDRGDGRLVCYRCQALGPIVSQASRITASDVFQKRLDDSTRPSRAELVSENARLRRMVDDLMWLLVRENSE